MARHRPEGCMRVAGISFFKQKTPQALADHVHRSRVIDSLRNTPEKLAYFYCNRAEENRREPRQVLATLIQQLAQSHSEEGPGLLTPVVDIYKDREEKGQKSAPLSLAECRDLLVQLIDAYPQTTICIDAIDEVDNETD